MAIETYQSTLLLLGVEGLVKPSVETYISDSSNYKGSIHISWDDSYIDNGERDVIIFCNGDNSGIYDPESTLVKSLTSMGYVFLQVFEPTSSIPAGSPPVNTVEIYSEWLTRDNPSFSYFKKMQAAHLNAVIGYGLTLINLNKTIGMSWSFKCSDNLVYIGQSRGASAGLYLKSMETETSGDISWDKSKIKHWILSNLTGGQITFSNGSASWFRLDRIQNDVSNLLINAPPSDSKVYVIMNDQDKTAGSEIRSIYQYAVPEKDRGKYHFLSQTLQGHTFPVSAIIQFAQDIKEGKDLSYYNEETHLHTKLKNMLGE